MNHRDERMQPPSDRDPWPSAPERQSYGRWWGGSTGRLEDRERGAPQYAYGGAQRDPGAYWRDRSSWQDDYGFGQRAHWHEPELFGRHEDPRYYGTGAPGYGGPGYTGGAYGFGRSAPRESTRLEGDYSDESAVSYEHDERRRRAAGRGGLHGERPWRERPFPRGPKGYQRSDERIKEDICERLMQSYFIDSSEVSVDVRGAKVMLEGTVPERYMKHAIEDVVDACLGVEDIENRIRVVSGLAATQQPPLTPPSTTLSGSKAKQ